MNLNERKLRSVRIVKLQRNFWKLWTWNLRTPLHSCFNRCVGGKIWLFQQTVNRVYCIFIVIIKVWNLIFKVQLLEFWSNSCMFFLFYCPVYAWVSFEVNYFSQCFTVFWNVIFFSPQNVGIDKGDIPDLTKVTIIEVFLLKANWKHL